MVLTKAGSTVFCLYFLPIFTVPGPSQETSSVPSHRLLIPPPSASQAQAVPHFALSASAVAADQPFSFQERGGGAGSVSVVPAPPPRHARSSSLDNRLLDFAEQGQNCSVHIARERKRMMSL